MAVSDASTTTSVRVVELPRSGRWLAVLTLSAGSRPATLGTDGLRDLSRALDSIANLDVQAVAVTGDRDIFCAGADLGIFRGATDRRAVQELVQLGHTVFGRLADLDVPTFALVNGAALGGGLELALHCRYRVVASSVTSVGSPKLVWAFFPGGVAPGWYRT